MLARKFVAAVRSAHPLQDAVAHGFVDGQNISIQLGSESMVLPLALDAGFPLGVIGLPVGLDGVPVFAADADVRVSGEGA